jgi:beta-aspartyl-dipeptidase (metallo-type)
LGTDSLTRSVESLYAKTQAFNAEGLTAFMLTGAYWLPSPTVTGSVGRDVTYLDPVIGVKLAMADQRGPYFTAGDLAALASDLRVAALVAAKPGRITVHTGVNPDGLDLIFEAVEHHHIRPDIFIPTHINRKKKSKLSEQALKLAGLGAFIDASCLDELPKDDHHRSAADFAMDALNKKVFHRLCFSSDAGGSLPKWSEDRSRILGMGIGSPSSLRFEFTQLVKTHGLDISQALCPLTSTPAKAYGLAGKKGELSLGADADLLILDPGTFEIRDVLARGQVMMTNGHLEKKGYFE